MGPITSTCIATTSLIILYLSFYGISSQKTDRKHVIWSWNCVSGRCKKTQVALGNSSQSLSSCKLTCGEFRALWPSPTGEIELGTRLLPFCAEDLKISLSNVSSRRVEDMLTRASQTFLRQLKNMMPSSSACLLGKGDVFITVEINVRSDDVALKWGTDESYTLWIVTVLPRIQVRITANTYFGARHGIETLSQLLVWDDSSGHFSIISRAYIVDRPIYTHRGLLIDTSRHFFSIKSIRRTIDAMSYSKLNVLHWHLTDSHSFPFKSERVPQMAEWGAYSASETYSMSDVRSIVEYGLLHGVQVIPELDAPAHAGNGWQWGSEDGLGELAVCVNEQPWRGYCIQPPCGQLNPINDNVYNVLERIYNDMLESFQSSAFHMGGDEVFFQCWNSTDDIVDWLERRNGTRTVDDFVDLWLIFQDKALRALDRASAGNALPVILWTSKLTDRDVIRYLDNRRYVIQTWVPATNNLPTILMDLGYRVVISTKDAWYLDHGFWGTTSYHNWRTVYDNKITSLIPRGKADRLLGGEVAMWSELVDENSLDVKVWPRAAALAERLWSDPYVESKFVMHRFAHHRQRMTDRGIRADAVTPEWCFLNEDSCL